jgi:hypothetical protein
VNTRSSVRKRRGHAFRRCACGLPIGFARLGIEARHQVAACHDHLVLAKRVDQDGGWVVRQFWSIVLPDGLACLYDPTQQ